MKKVKKRIILFSFLSVLFFLLAGAIAACTYLYYLDMDIAVRIISFALIGACVAIAIGFIIKASSARYIKDIISSIENGDASSKRISKHIQSNEGAVEEYIKKAIKRGYLDGYKLDDGMVYKDKEKHNIKCDHCCATIITDKDSEICPYCGNIVVYKAPKQNKVTQEKTEGNIVKDEQV